MQKICACKYKFTFSISYSFLSYRWKLSEHKEKAETQQIKVCNAILYCFRAEKGVWCMDHMMGLLPRRALGWLEQEILCIILFSSHNVHNAQYLK